MIGDSVPHVKFTNRIGLVTVVHVKIVYKCSTIIAHSSTTVLEREITDFSWLFLPPLSYPSEWLWSAWWCISWQRLATTLAALLLSSFAQSSSEDWFSSWLASFPTISIWDAQAKQHANITKNFHLKAKMNSIGVRVIQAFVTGIEK